MKRIIAVVGLVLLTALNIAALPVPAYEFQSVVGLPCGDPPSDLCTPLGNMLVQTKTLLSTYSEQGWQLIYVTPMLYTANNDGVVFMLGRNPGITLPVKQVQFEFVMAMSCGSSRLCTPDGTLIEDALKAYVANGWQLNATAPCKYQYEQGVVGMVVHLLAR